MKIALRPLKRYFDSAKAAIAFKRTVRIVAVTVTKTVFLR